MQTDPKGAEPVDVAKEFVKALIDNDKATVEKLLGWDNKNIDDLYSDNIRLEKIIDFYRNITLWEQTYYTTDYAGVKAHIKTNTGELDTFFELTIASPQIKTSRSWIVNKFY